MPDPTSSERPAPARDPLLEALVFVARARGHQVSREGLTAGLPLEDNRLTPSLLGRAAERAGLHTRLERCPLDRLSPAALPAIALLADGACVLQARTATGYSVVDGEAAPRDATLDELAARYSGTCVLLRTDFEFDERAPELHELHQRHWFWQAMREHLPLYRDVMMAAALVNVFALGMPLFTMNVYDRVVPNRATDTLWILAAGLLIVLIADFALRTMRGYFLDLASKRIDVKLSSQIMARVLGMRLEEKPASVGSLASTLRAFESVRDFVTSATVTALIDLPFALLFIAVIAWIAWPMLIPIAIAILAVLAYGTTVGSRLHELSETTYRASAMRNAVLIEGLVGLESIKAMGSEGVMQQRWERSAAFLARTSAQLRLLASSSVQTAMLAQQLTAVLIVIVGVYLIGEAQLSLGGLIASSMLASRALAPLGQITGLLTQYHGAMTALEGLNQVMERPVERPQGAHFLSRESFRGDIEFRDVAFSYPHTDLNALRGVSLRIKAGEHIAILGRTGSGKSTLLRLILGLYRPSAGSVLIDGIDLRQLDPGELRRSIGYVPQDLMLFFGSLRENLAIAAPQADDADIVRAIANANLADFVNQHPKGIDMLVGERGESLSGGQRQSVAIARALIKEPPILLMDEPTGSMDHSSEEALKARLREFCKGRTLVVVTHRTALLDIVDRIIVTDHGKIVADGPKATVIEALRQGRVGKGL